MKKKKIKFRLADRTLIEVRNPKEAGIIDDPEEEGIIDEDSLCA